MGASKVRVSDNPSALTRVTVTGRGGTVSGMTVSVAIVLLVKASAAAKATRY